MSNFWKLPKKKPNEQYIVLFCPVCIMNSPEGGRRMEMLLPFICFSKLPIQSIRLDDRDLDTPYYKYICMHCKWCEVYPNRLLKE